MLQPSKKKEMWKKKIPAYLIKIWNIGPGKLFVIIFFILFFLAEANLLTACLLFKICDKSNYKFWISVHFYLINWYCIRFSFSFLLWIELTKIEMSWWITNLLFIVKKNWQIVNIIWNLANLGHFHFTLKWNVLWKYRICFRDRIWKVSWDGIHNLNPCVHFYKVSQVAR